MRAAVGTAVASPVLPIVTCEVFEEAQAQVLVISEVLLSLKVAVALNCFVLPRGILTAAGITAMDFSVTVTAGALLPPPHPAAKPRRSSVQATDFAVETTTPL